MTDRSYKDGTLPGWKGEKETGRRAAFAIADELPRRQAEVLGAFVKRGAQGASCDDLQEELSLPAYVIRPRASELERKGKLFPVGKKPGAFGHNVTVYSAEKPLDEAA